MSTQPMQDVAELEPRSGHRRRNTLITLVVVAAALACGTSRPVRDEKVSSDAGTSSVEDAGVADDDGGTSRDAGSPDSGPSDAGHDESDGGSPDGGASSDGGRDLDGGTIGLPCSSAPSDCGPGEACVDGLCRSNCCKNDGDCPANQTCSARYMCNDQPCGVGGSACPNGLRCFEDGYCAGDPADPPQCPQYQSTIDQPCTSDADCTIGGSVGQVCNLNKCNPTYLCIDRPTYDFGKTTPHVVVQRSVWVWNCSKVQTMIDVINVTGTGFRVKGGPIRNTILVPGDGVIVPVEFEPWNTGTYSGTLIYSSYFKTPLGALTGECVP